MAEDASVVALRVGRTIKAIRATKGMAQAELAKLIEFTPTGVWKVEAGKTDVPLSTLVRIANALDTSVERLVGGLETGPGRFGFFREGDEHTEDEIRQIEEQLERMFPEASSGGIVWGPGRAERSRAQPGGRA